MDYVIYTVKVPEVLSRLLGPEKVKTTIRDSLEAELNWASDNLKGKITVTKPRAMKNNA